MKKFIITTAATFGVFAFLVVPALVAQPVDAVNASKQICEGSGGNWNGNKCINKDAKKDLGSWMKDIVNVLLFVIGAISVIMVVIGGLRYVTSGGDANQTKAAKDTILYSVIGLIVAILAYAIINFVVNNFK